jgi:hypothetical protein
MKKKEKSSAEAPKKRREKDRAKVHSPNQKRNLLFRRKPILECELGSER